MRSIARSARQFVARPKHPTRLTRCPRIARFALSATLFIMIAIARPTTTRAASSGQTQLYFFQGQQAATSNGDFISANTNIGGLGSVYQFYIEVPPGLASLVLELFDADVGRGTTTEAAAGRDRQRGGSWDTSVIYTVVNPSGATVGTPLTCSATACTDNAWQTLATIANPAAGHWILRINMGNNDDINAVGLRANDGDPSAGGTELNVYYDSYTEYGVNPPATGTSSVTFTEYPYITSGCSFGENDYDFDSDQGTVGSLSFTSRAGLLSTTIPSGSLSANDTWTRNTISGYQSDSTASDYGIWTLDSTITSYVNAAGQNGNYAPIYLSAFNAAANPPTAQPQSNAFRVYLATDAGGAPVKPYVEQFARFFSGARTPTVGSTTRIAITVRVTNPTTRAITFSATNNVRAQVPGGGVTYAGAATSDATQGSIIAEPATNGTGFVTWNPGTLGAGAAAYMTYQVDVVPTSAGQRLPVTAVPGTNGTRAIWVDETGNTAARSTITFGQLCELAVTAGTTTAAEIARFETHREGSQSVIEWTTASEASTIGFELYRRNRFTGEFTKRNDGLLLGLLDAPAGGTYRFVDPLGDARSGIDEYYIVETEAFGERRMYGPLGNDAPPGPQRVTSLLDVPREAYARVPIERASKRMIFSRDRLVHISPRKDDDAAFIDVRDEGMYEVETSLLAQALGLPEKQAAALVRTHGLTLTAQGAPVAWSGDATGEHFRFYGEALESPYTRDNAYRVARGSGVGMPVEAVHAPRGDRAASFLSALHAEEDKIPALALSPDPESDYWYWDYVQSGDAVFGMRTFKIDVPSPAQNASSASLTVSLQGASSTGIAGEHHAAVALNGTNIGESRWTGVAPLAATFTFDARLLTPGQNEIEILGLLDGGTPYSVFFVDAFDVAYPRAYNAQGGALAFTAAPGESIDVSGFASPHIALYDVADPRRPRSVSGAVITPTSAGYGASFRAATPGARYVAVTAESVLRPERVRSGGGAALRASRHAADYLILAPSALTEAARPLADLRASQGYRAEVVDLQDVFDAFGHGLSTPWAIRDFLAYARATWATPPRFVVLAGDGSYDYKDILGTNEPSLVPPVLVRGVNGIYSSDATLADVTGNDGAPDMAIGRIPVSTPEDLTSYIAKIIAHESAAPSAGALLLAGPADGDADFGATSDALATNVGGLTPIDRIYLDATTLDEARARLQHDLGQSPAFVSYFGHGAMNALAASGLLRADDVASLPARARLPVFTAMTCAVGRFELPGLTSLGEALIRQRDAGAIAVFSPSGLSLHADAAALAERFFRESLASASAAPTVGEAAQRALAKSAASGAEPAVLAVYNLLGDPALRLATARPSAPPPASGAGGGMVE